MNAIETNTHGSILLLLHFFPLRSFLCLSLKILIFMMVVSWNPLPNVLFRVLRATVAMITYKQKQTFRLRYVWKCANLHMCHCAKCCCEFCEWWHEHLASVATAASTREYFVVMLNRHPLCFMLLTIPLSTNQVFIMH